MWGTADAPMGDGTARQEDLAAGCPWASPRHPNQPSGAIPLPRDPTFGRCMPFNATANSLLTRDGVCDLALGAITTSTAREQAGVMVSGA